MTVAAPRPRTWVCCCRRPLLWVGIVEFLSSGDVTELMVWLLFCGGAPQLAVLFAAGTPLVGALCLPRRYHLAKLSCFVGFHTMEGVLLSTLGVLGPRVLSPALLTSAAVSVGSWCVAGVAPPGLYATLSFPLSCGLCALSVASLASIFTRSSGYETVCSVYSLSLTNAAC